MSTAVIACPAPWLSAVAARFGPRARTLEDADADWAWTDPILAFAPDAAAFEAQYSRLAAAPFCLFTAASGPDEATIAAVLTALDRLRATDQQALGDAHQALAALRRAYENTVDRFGDLEALANDARISDLTPVFAAAPADGAGMIVRPGCWLQPLALDARDFNCVSFTVLAGRPHGRAALLHRGSGAVLARWTVTPDAVRDGVLRLAWPRVWTSGGLAIRFDWPAEPPGALATFAVAAPHPVPEFCVSVNGAKQPQPLAATQHLARPNGATPAGALWPDDAGAPPTRRLLTPETLATARLISPATANPKLVAVGADLRLGVHPKAGAEVVAGVDLNPADAARPKRLWARLRNDHPDNDGVEMRLGLARSVDDLAGAVFSPWARLGPLEATLAHVDDAAGGARAVVICARLPSGASARNAWAQVSCLAVEQTPDAPTSARDSADP